MKKITLLTPLLFLLIASCRDSREGLVPFVPVNITINVNEPTFFNLTVPTGWVYITGGSRGIIVYRKSQTEFVAIERHSTFEPQNNCAVSVESSNLILKDPCSDSKWLISDGSIVNGPASRPLLQYEVVFQDPFLYVNN